MFRNFAICAIFLHTQTHIHTKLTAAIPYFSHSQQCCLPIILLRMRQRMNIAEQVERSERRHGHECRRRQWSARSYIRANKKWSLVDEKLAHIKCLLAFSKYLYLLPSLTHSLPLSLVSYSRPRRSSSRVNIPPFSHHSLRSFSYLKLYLSSSTRLFFLTPNEAFSTLHAWIHVFAIWKLWRKQARDMSGGKLEIYVKFEVSVIIRRRSSLIPRQIIFYTFLL